MIGDQSSPINPTHKWACVQFIAEVSLNANCKDSDLRMALSIIADLAFREGSEKEIELFYQAK